MQLLHTTDLFMIGTALFFPTHLIWFESISMISD